MKSPEASSCQAINERHHGHITYLLFYPPPTPKTKKGRAALLKMERIFLCIFKICPRLHEKPKVLQYACQASGRCVTL